MLWGLAAIRNLSHLAAKNIILIQRQTVSKPWELSFHGVGKNPWAPEIKSSRPILHSQVKEREKKT